MIELTEKERKDTRMSTLYELRLIVLEDERKTFTKDELLKLFDQIAIAEK